MFSSSSLPLYILTLSLPPPLFVLVSVSSLVGWVSTFTDCLFGVAIETYECVVVCVLSCVCMCARMGLKFCFMHNDLIQALTYRIRLLSQIV